MPIAESTLPASTESVFEIGDRLTELLKQAKQKSVGSAIPESDLPRLANMIEALRSRVVRRQERDPRSLFDLDEQLIELLDRAEDVAESGDLPAELTQEMNDYLEAFRTKVDRIAGYWRWQESIATICGEEAERLSARKRAAERRVNRLKDMLLVFMMSRGFKKLEGDKAAIGLQTNGMASLIVDDPLQIDECFFERSLRFTKTDLHEIVCQLADGRLRQRLETALASEGWTIDGSAMRFAITNGSSISGARLVKGQHVRLR